MKIDKHDKNTKIDKDTENGQNRPNRQKEVENEESVKLSQLQLGRQTIQTRFNSSGPCFCSELDPLERKSRRSASLA